MASLYDAFTAACVQLRQAYAYDILQLDLVRQPDGSWLLHRRVGKLKRREAGVWRQRALNFFQVVSWLPPWVTLRREARTAMIQGARNSLLALDPVHRLHLTRTESPAGCVGMDTGEPVPLAGRRVVGQAKKNALADIQCGLPGVATCMYWPANLLRLCGDRFSEAQLLQPYAEAWSTPFQLTVVLQRGASQRGELLGSWGPLRWTRGSSKATRGPSRGTQYVSYLCMRAGLDGLVAETNAVGAHQSRDGGNSRRNKFEARRFRCC